MEDAMALFKVNRFKADEAPSSTKTVFATMRDLTSSSENAGVPLTISIANGGEEGNVKADETHFDCAVAAMRVGDFASLLLNPAAVLMIRSGTLLARAARDPHSSMLVTQWVDERCTNATPSTAKYADDTTSIIEWANLVCRAFSRAVVVEQKVNELVRLAATRQLAAGGVPTSAASPAALLAAGFA